VEDAIRSALAMRTWAVVGASPEPFRDSNRIAAMLESRGYRVIRVNPNWDAVVPSLDAVGEPVDVVDIFRRPDQAGAHVDEAIAVGARAVWMQLGVIDEAAASRARAAGLQVIMDRCPAIEMPRLGIAGYSGRGRDSAASVRPNPGHVAPPNT
jgi:predicted CoA-binding protein